MNLSCEGLEGERFLFVGSLPRFRSASCTLWLSNALRRRVGNLEKKKKNRPECICLHTEPHFPSQLKWLLKLLWPAAHSPSLSLNLIVSAANVNKSSPVSGLCIQRHRSNDQRQTEQLTRLAAATKKSFLIFREMLLFFCDLR